MSKNSKNQNKQPEQQENLPAPTIPQISNQYSFIQPDDIIYIKPEELPAGAPEEEMKVCFTSIPASKVSTLESEENARYMTADQMRRLTDNVKKDKALTSAVLLYPDFETKTLVVLSGNHRVEAAKIAGHKIIPAMVIQSYLTPEQRLAVQLSHNAISGQDDPNLLEKLYESLTMEYKAYSGLTDDSFDFLDKLNIDSLAIGSPQYEEVALHFLPKEKEAFIEHIEKLKSPPDKKTYLLAEYEDFTAFFNTIVAIKEFKNVYNTAIAIRIMTEMAMERLQQLEAEAEQEKATAKEEKASDGEQT